MSSTKYTKYRPFRSLLWFQPTGALTLSINMFTGNRTWGILSYNRNNFHFLHTKLNSCSFLNFFCGAILTSNDDIQVTLSNQTFWIYNYAKLRVGTGASFSYCSIIKYNGIFFEAWMHKDFYQLKYIWNRP